MWFSRCRRNAQVLSPGTVEGSGVWPVCSWLVPVVNLWVPRRFVLEIQRASSAPATDKGRDDLLVNAWWVAWAAHGVIAAGSQFGGGTSTSMPLLMASEALNLAAAVLAIFVVQRITGLQSAALPTASPTPIGTP